MKKKRLNHSEKPKSTSSELWRTVPSYPFYELSSLGRLRLRESRANLKKGKLVRPSFSSSATHGRYELTSSDGHQHKIPVHHLMRETFPDYGPYQRLDYPPKWIAQVKELNSLEEGISPSGSRLCHKCGRPTNNYWCQVCWKKYYLSISPDDPGLPEGDEIQEPFTAQR